MECLLGRFCKISTPNQCPAYRATEKGGWEQGSSLNRRPLGPRSLRLPSYLFQLFLELPFLPLQGQQLLLQGLLALLHRLQGMAQASALRVELQLLLHQAGQVVPDAGLLQLRLLLPAQQTRLFLLQLPEGDAQGHCEGRQVLLLLLLSPVPPLAFSHGKEPGSSRPIPPSAPFPLKPLQNMGRFVPRAIYGHLSKGYRA